MEAEAPVYSVEPVCGCETRRPTYASEAIVTQRLGYPFHLGTVAVPCWLAVRIYRVGFRVRRARELGSPNPMQLALSGPQAG